MRKNILYKIIIDNQTDLDNYLYCFILDIKKFQPLSIKVLKKTRIINLYDKKVSKR